jgi:hypothetical protein
MTALFLGLCALACPLSMLLMMWLNRRRDAGSRPHDEET